jgi:hypothetical protein
MKTGEQVSFSPREFAALFSKEQSWGYRQIYAGKVKAITEYGRMMVPASEVERILASAERYEGKKKPPQTKAQIQALKPQLKNAWQEFIRQKRAGEKPSTDKPAPAALPRAAVNRPGARRSALARLTRPKKSE